MGFDFWKHYYNYGLGGRRLYVNDETILSEKLAAIKSKQESLEEMREAGKPLKAAVIDDDTYPY